MLANQFICASNHKHEAYQLELENAFLNGHDKYPNIVAEALEIVGQCSNNMVPHAPGGEGVVFAQTTSSKEGDGNEESLPASGKHPLYQMLFM